MDKHQYRLATLAVIAGKHVHPVALVRTIGGITLYRDAGVRLAGLQRRIQGRGLGAIYARADFPQGRSNRCRHATRGLRSRCRHSKGWRDRVRGHLRG